MKIKQSVSETLKRQIFHLASHGYGSRKISERVNLSRSLVRRIMAERSQEDLKSSFSKGSKLSDFKDIILEKVKDGLTTTRILREIKELGYSGGRTILGEQTAKMRVDLGIASKSKAKRRFETPPGQEMQLDWSPYKVLINGQSVKIHVLGVMSCYSRKLFFAAFRNERQPTEKG